MKTTATALRHPARPPTEGRGQPKPETRNQKLAGDLAGPGGDRTRECPKRSPARPGCRAPLLGLASALFVGSLFAGLTALAADAQAAGPVADQASAYRTIGLSIAAAVSVGASILGAGYAVGRIGSAAIGAIAEKPELLPRAMLFVALGEGLAVLGFAFAIWLLLRV